jgi:hypothetical protein
METFPTSNSMLGHGGSTVTFENLSFEVKDKEGVKRLVDNVSVKVTQGQVSSDAWHRHWCNQNSKTNQLTLSADARYSWPIVRTPSHPRTPIHSDSMLTNAVVPESRLFST